MTYYCFRMPVFLSGSSGNNWKYTLAQRPRPNAQLPDESPKVPYAPAPDVYCLVQSGFLSSRTLLHYRKPLRMACCQSCQLIYTAIEVVKPRWRDKNLEMKSISLDKKEIPSNGVKISSWTVFKVKLLEDRNSWYIQLARPTDESLLEKQSNPFSSLESLLTALAIDRSAAASRWLKACVLGHSICRVPDPSFMPRRLIAVGDDSREPRLVDGLSSFPFLRPHYAALSYCWGPAQNTFKTTRENIESNKNNIPLSLLPKTIQDAIRVCRALEIPYLWVDALCIIQGDVGENDWYEQSGKMRKIYSNSYLTIAADDCPGSTWGFWEINPKDWEQLSLRCGSNNNCVNTWVKINKVTVLTDRGILSTRGWALQEGVLPNRILHFTCLGMNWECSQCCRSEYGKVGFNMMMLTFRAFRVIKLGRDVRTAPPEGFGELAPVYDEINSTHITDFLTTCTPRSVYFAWNAIMECYSEKDLTKPADRLTAVSGLAGLVVQYLDLPSTAYLAGLWQDDIAEGLLWYVKPSYKTPRRPRRYVAPSWSWACIDGPIEYFKERYQFRFEPDIQVLHAECKSIPEDPTGKVTDGHIFLEGYLVAVRLYAIPVSTRQTGGSSYNGINGSASRAHRKQITQVQPLLVGTSEKYKVRQYEVLYDEDVWKYPLSEEAKYYCLRVGVTNDSITGGQRYWWLVLRKVEGESEDYQRVGLGYFQALKRSFYLFEMAPLATIKLI